LRPAVDIDRVGIFTAAGIAAAVRIGTGRDRAVIVLVPPRHRRTGRTVLESTIFGQMGFPAGLFVERTSDRIAEHAARHRTDHARRDPAAAAAELRSDEAAGHGAGNRPRTFAGTSAARARLGAGSEIGCKEG